jgi:hypothetical protein
MCVMEHQNFARMKKNPEKWVAPTPRTNSLCFSYFKLSFSRSVPFMSASSLSCCLRNSFMNSGTSIPCWTRLRTLVFNKQKNKINNWSWNHRQKINLHIPFQLPWQQLQSLVLLYRHVVARLRQAMELHLYLWFFLQTQTKWNLARKASSPKSLTFFDRPFSSYNNLGSSLKVIHFYSTLNCQIPSKKLQLTSFSSSLRVLPRGPINSPTKFMSGCSSCGMNTLSVILVDGGLSKAYSFQWYKCYYYQTFLPKKNK